MSRKQRSKSSTKFRNIFQHCNLTLTKIQPLTTNQATAFSYFNDNHNLLLLGKAGSGKTYQAIYHALRDIEQGKARKLILVRSPVPTKDIGHLPGTLMEKANVYELPYAVIVNELFGRDDAYQSLVKHNVIEFMLTSYIRGLTLDNCIIIYDEIQNASINEASTIITRAGKNTKVHFCGDIAQCDLIRKSDRRINLFLNILQNMPEYRTVYFDIDDIVRGGLTKSFLTTQHELYGDEIII